MDRTQRALLTAATLIGGLAPAGKAGAQVSFTPLGTLPGKGERLSLAGGISGDGLTVVGESRVESKTGFHAAFRWTSATGMQAVTSTAPLSSGRATAASFDGSVIVGTSAGRPFRWTEGTGPVPLAALPGGNGGGIAYGVSDSGDTVVGQGDADQSFRAARWTNSGGQALGDLPGWFGSFAQDVSASGDVVVGAGFDANLSETPFRWTSSGGMAALPLLPGFLSGRGVEVSSDGLITTGWCVSSGVSRAVRWIPGGIEDLGLLAGETSSHALAMTADGATILGLSGLRMFLWTEAGGMVDLAAILAPVVPAGWSSLIPTSVSADGATIAGYAGNLATGFPEAWVATIPVPGTPFVLLPLSFMWAMRRRR